jgi:hypothetical protein
MRTICAFLFASAWLAAAVPPDYAPVLAGARQVPLRAVVSTNVWWRHATATNGFASLSQYAIADGSAIVHLTIACRTNAWTLAVERGPAHYKPAKYSDAYGFGGGGIVEAFTGDVNGDGFADVVMLESNGGACGLAAERTDNLLLLSDGSGGYRLWGYETYDATTNDFTALGKTAPCSVMLAQHLWADAPDQRTHSYWVFAPYEVQGCSLSALKTDVWPMWIWYKIKPNHEPTTHFSASEKRRFWRAHLREHELVREIALERLENSNSSIRARR